MGEEEWGILEEVLAPTPFFFSQLLLRCPILLLPSSHFVIDGKKNSK
jgi:hypothetical protein